MAGEALRERREHRNHPAGANGHALAGGENEYRLAERRGVQNKTELAYLFLLIAIFAEVLATSLLKSTEGFSRLWPTVVCLVCLCRLICSCWRC